MPKNFAPDKQSVNVAIGTLLLTGTLNSKGRTADKLMALAGKLKKRIFIASPVKFQITVARRPSTT